jgi:integrase
VAVEAWAYDKRTTKKIRKTFTGKGALAEAKGWRADATGAVRRGTMRAPTQITLREAAEAWLEGAKSGGIRTRSGDLFKPSTLHGYEQALTSRVLPVLGGARLSDIARADLQDFAERMLATGLDPSTIRNTLMPLRAIFGRACDRGELAVNPTARLRLPAVRGRRDRIIDPATSGELLAVLPDDDRALWACALFAGLRRGELLALRWSDVDLAAGVIRVERSYDPRSGATGEPKSRAGKRKVPIPAVLRDHLDEHKLRAEWHDGLVFGRTPVLPFNDSSIAARAASAWRGAAVERAREAGLSDAEIEQVAKDFAAPLTLHEARHTFASMMIAAGVNAKALSSYLGHSSIAITFDRYGHMMPGNEDEAAGLLDAYLARADTALRLAQLGSAGRGGDD